MNEIERGATELRPPPQLADKQWHWLQHDDGDTIVARWDPGCWYLFYSDEACAPNDMGGWHYLSPVEPPILAPEPPGPYLEAARDFAGR